MPSVGVVAFDSVASSAGNVALWQIESGTKGIWITSVLIDTNEDYALKILDVTELILNINTPALLFKYGSSGHTFTSVFKSGHRAGTSIDGSGAYIVNASNKPNFVPFFVPNGKFFTVAKRSAAQAGEVSIGFEEVT